uniref:Protein PAM68, chloroplastic n=1 Tax=Leersia perrieri TaxID=77586 RepID=A0A0D9WPT6_9ORYZ
MAPLAPTRAALSFGSSPTFRLHPPPNTLLLARARRNKSSRSPDEAAAEPKVITIGRPGKKSRGGGGGRKTQQQPPPTSEEDDEFDDEDERDAAIPEVVTNRMMRRVGVSVGAPLAVGVGFFPAFYYLKTVAKVDVPTWIPFGVSFIFFGAALLGVSYGIVSASWDPAREGSLLGWNEARRNWPVFWESLRGGDRR